MSVNNKETIKCSDLSCYLYKFIKKFILKNVLYYMLKVNIYYVMKQHNTNINNFQI